MGIADDLDAMPQVVEEEEGVGKEETGVVTWSSSGLVSAVVSKKRPIITEKADGSAQKRGRSGDST